MISIRASTIFTEISLTPWQIGLILGVLTLGVILGRPEWGLGIYLPMTLWGRLVLFGSTPSTYVLLTGIILATLHYLYLNRPSAAYPPGVPAPPGSGLVIAPERGRWIVLWMLLWWGWMLLLLTQFDAPLIPMLRPILFDVITPTPIFLLISRDLWRVRGFAIAYVFTSAFGFWLAINLYGITPAYLLTDPGLDSFGLVRLGVSNYHFFSHFSAISLILALALYLEARNVVWQVATFALVGWSAYFLMLAGARQSMAGAVIVGVLFLIWTILRGHPVVGTRGIGLAIAIAFFALFLYQTAPGLFVRDDEGGDITRSFNVVADRGDLWAKGLSYFYLSPIWGWGFQYKMWSHNLFIGTLADQGLVGMVFFLGLIVFALMRLPGVWALNISDPRGLWRMAFLGIFLFAMIHGQASGNTSSTAHLYWSLAILWWLESPPLPPRPWPLPAVQPSAVRLLRSTVAPPPDAGRATQGVRLLRSSAPKP